ncbi:MAG: hypothetical protein DMG08_25890, partial [Acidobacteria bacterium]
MAKRQNRPGVSVSPKLELHFHPMVNFEFRREVEFWQVVTALGKGDAKNARAGLRGDDYNSRMTRAYEEIIDFIAAGTTPTRVATFE